MPFDPGVILIGGMLLLVVLMFQRSGKQRRELAAVQAGLAPGTQVMTSSGLYATVVAVDGEVVTLQTGPGATSRWDRRAVIKVLAADTAVPTTAEADGRRADEAHASGAEATGETEPNLPYPDETNPSGPA